MLQSIRETRDLNDFVFREQITQAGLSSPFNIAERLERSSAADQCKFVDYARACCAEVRTQTIVGGEAGFIDTLTFQNWTRETKELATMINGLIRSIKIRAQLTKTAN